MLRPGFLPALLCFLQIGWAISCFLHRHNNLSHRANWSGGTNSKINPHLDHNTNAPNDNAEDHPPLTRMAIVLEVVARFLFAYSNSRRLVFIHSTLNPIEYTLSSVSRSLVSSLPSPHSVSLCYLQHYSFFSCRPLSLPCTQEGVRRREILNSALEIAIDYILPPLFCESSCYSA